MKFRFQASFFADLASVAATSDVTLRVLQALRHRGLDSLLPSTIMEVAPPRMQPQPRLRFAQPHGEFEVVVASGRLDVFENYTAAEGAGLTDFRAFGHKAQQCIEAVLEGTAIRGSRIAALCSEIEPAIPIQQLEQKFSKLLNPPEYYAENPPVEWTFRANTRQALQLPTTVEAVNVILKVERLQGQFVFQNAASGEFDRIVSEYDVNTLVPNVDARFGAESVGPFVSAAADMIDRLSEQLRRKLA